MSLSLRQFRYFVATAEAGQVSQAAASLNVSQSTVTAALQKLEAELGANLFSVASPLGWNSLSRGPVSSRTRETCWPR